MRYYRQLIGQEMSHAITLHVALRVRSPAARSYRAIRRITGNVSCNLITGTLLREMFHVILLQTVPYRNCLT